MTRAKRIAAAFLMLVAGCQKNNLPDYEKLGELRVVVIAADKPEVDPGATVTLTPLLSDIDGGGRALTYTLVGCADFGVSYGATPTCDGRPDRVVIQADQPVTGLAGPEYTGLAPAIAVTIPTSVLDDRGAVDRYNGVSYLLFYSVTAANGPTVTAMKRIVVSAKPEKNHNPSFMTPDGVLANNSPLKTLPTSPVVLTTGVPASAIETYTSLSDDGTQIQRTENIVVSWFVSDGELDKQKTGLGTGNEWKPPAQKPAGRAVVLIVVLRDGRGGEAHLVLTL